MADIIDQLMYAIGQSESGGNYTRGNSVSDASGKYQYLNSTWANFAGYHRAADAPPAVQDAKARADLTNKMARYHGDIKSVIQSWFYPVGVGHDSLVPPGNSISMGQYAARVMKNMGMAPPASTGYGPVATATTAATAPTQSQAIASIQALHDRVMSGFDSLFGTVASQNGPGVTSMLDGLLGQPMTPLATPLPPETQTVTTGITDSAPSTTGTVRANEAPPLVQSAPTEAPVRNYGRAKAI